MTGEPQAPPERHVSVGELVGVPIVLTFLLFVADAHRHDVWGVVWSVIYLAIVAAIGGAAVGDLVRGVRHPRPDDLPLWFTATSLALMGLLPLAAWCLVFPARQVWAVPLPLVPAVMVWFAGRVGATRTRRGGT